MTRSDFLAEAEALYDRMEREGFVPGDDARLLTTSGANFSRLSQALELADSPITTEQEVEEWAVSDLVSFLIAVACRDRKLVESARGVVAHREAQREKTDHLDPGYRAELEEARA